MNETTKTFLIVGGVAVVAFLAYKQITAQKAAGAGRVSPVTASTAGTGNSVPAATGNGSGGETSFWNTLGSVGKGLNSGTSAVESLYNSASDLFGGNSSSTNTGQGNNGTEG